MDPVPLRELAGEFLLAGALGQVLEGPTAAPAHGVVEEALGLGGRQGFEVLQQHVVVVEKAFEGAGVAKWQVAGQDDAVESGEDGTDLVGVFG
ncbi:MAG: hypothetical protein L0Z62_20950 [Gemmataceae bacterium]|nr:hypothetical protein [Gemmataceae bacterium]